MMHQHPAPLHTLPALLRRNDPVTHMGGPVYVWPHPDAPLIAGYLSPLVDGHQTVLLPDGRRLPLDLHPRD